MRRVDLPDLMGPITIVKDPLVTEPNDTLNVAEDHRVIPVKIAVDDGDLRIVAGWTLQVLMFNNWLQPSGGARK